MSGEWNEQLYSSKGAETIQRLIFSAIVIKRREIFKLFYGEQSKGLRANAKLSMRDADPPTVVIKRLTTLVGLTSRYLSLPSVFIKATAFKVLSSFLPLSETDEPFQRPLGLAQRASTQQEEEEEEGRRSRRKEEKKRRTVVEAKE